jgi:pimeloyl-ACP methyl ester carboxylesterase
MNRRARRAAIAVAVLCAIVLVTAEPVQRYTRAAALLLTVIDQHDPTGVTALVRSPVLEQDATIPLPGRTLRARVYRPKGEPRGFALVLHGVHPDGIDEARLRGFARGLAAIGIETRTPELSELTEQRILPSTIDDIGACAAEVRRQTGAKQGALGISFSGGLLLMAASRSPGASALRYVVTVGAHHDLRRVLRYYAGEPVHAPDGREAEVAAHPYGGRVMVSAHVEQFFDPSDRPIAGSALAAHLQGRQREARKLAESLSPAGHDTFAIATERSRRSELNVLLLRVAEARPRELLALSPAAGLQQLAVPSYLVHGDSDPIVPSLETEWLAKEVPARSLRAALVTPVLRHAESADAPRVRDQLALVRFVAGFLGE